MPSLLQSRKDSFRFKLPDSFFPNEVRDKYAEKFQEENGLFKDPVEFLNQTIVGVKFLGMGNGIVIQEQTGHGNGSEDTGLINKFGQHSRIDMNRFRYGLAEFTYRSAINPLSMIDKRFSIEFNHTLGFWNYFFMFETFFWQTMRDTRSDDKSLNSLFNIHILDPATGSELSRITMMSPLIEKIDELNLSYQSIKPSNDTFTVDFRFNNIDYQFFPYSTD